MTEIRLFGGEKHDCSYLPGRGARSWFVDPSWPLDGGRYASLLANGFRRSGGYVYRPGCEGCDACVPVRIPLAEFSPRRRHRRLLREMRGRLRVVPKQGTVSSEQFALYHAYVTTRHADGGMSEMDRAALDGFLRAEWLEPLMLELRIGDELLAVAATDQLPGALSALYTFYDPARLDHAPGVLAILAQIELGQQLGLDWLYLGFWVGACEKMSYKLGYRPMEYFREGAWQTLSPGEEMPDSMLRGACRT